MISGTKIRTILLALALTATLPACTGRPGYFGLGEAIEDKPAYFDKPYAETALPPNQAQWVLDNWIPENWNSPEDGERILKRLYAGDIITGQSGYGRQPRLEVGENFLRLSDKDKIRVVEFIDHYYAISQNNPAQIIIVERDKTGKQLGYYSQGRMHFQ